MRNIIDSNCGHINSNMRLGFPRNSLRHFRILLSVFKVVVTQEQQITHCLYYINKSASRQTTTPKVTTKKASQMA